MPKQSTQYKFKTDARTSERMARVGVKDTTLEMEVKGLLDHLGVRYERHPGDIRGKPDFVMRKKMVAIFAHGCFWHRHRNCKRATTPARNRASWLEKFEANRRRDAAVRRQLNRQGWKVIEIWECEIASPGRALSRLRKALDMSRL